MRQIKTLLVLLVILLLTSMEADASEGVYIVKSGDNLWTIARQHNMLVSEIKTLNSLSSDDLQIGDRLILQEVVSNSDSYSASTTSETETAPATEPESGPDIAYYTVKPGDCLWAVANSCGMSVEQLRALNSLKSDALFPGDRLRINGQLPPITIVEEEVSTTPSRSGSLIVAGTVLQKAADYLGTPYKYGGSGPGGFDCSGFVKYVFSEFGYNLPRTASDQASEGVHVDKSNLMPGDLVFFSCGSSRIDHAGIYVGKGEFIHSSSPRSGGVIYSSLLDGYYLNTYVGARRVLH